MRIRPNLLLLFATNAQHSVCASLLVLLGLTHTGLVEASEENLSFLRRKFNPAVVFRSSSPLRAGVAETGLLRDLSVEFWWLRIKYIMPRFCSSGMKSIWFSIFKGRFERNRSTYRAAMEIRSLTLVPFYFTPWPSLPAAPGAQSSGRRGAGGNMQQSKHVPSEQPRSREEKEINKTDFPPCSHEKEINQQWLTSCLHLPLNLWLLAQRDASSGLGYCISSSLKPIGPPPGLSDVKRAEFCLMVSSENCCCASPEMSSQCSKRPSSTGILPHMAVWWGPPWWWSLHPDLWGENNLLHWQRSKLALVSVVCLIASYWDPAASENHWLLWISPKNTYNFGTIICLTCCILLFPSAVQTTVLPL